jgi:hypothetical protein
MQSLVSIFKNSKNPQVLVWIIQEKRLLEKVRFQLIDSNRYNCTYLRTLTSWSFQCLMLGRSTGLRKHMTFKVSLKHKKTAHSIPQFPQIHANILLRFYTNGRLYIIVIYEINITM